MTPHLQQEHLVCSSFESLRTDIELAHAALDALGRDSAMPPCQFSVKVQHAVVTLLGTARWYYQRAAAERAVRFLPGVRGVRNQIAVALPVLAKDVKKRISDALHRSVSLDASRIRVDTIDGTVTLRGTVRSAAEREDAERAAWSAPGVKAVKDEMVVLY